MATTATPQVGGRVPVGTTVEARKASNWITNQLPPSGTSPPGSADASAAVATDGTVSFTGLTAGTRYFAYASVGGAGVYIQFFTAPGGSDSAADVELTQPIPAGTNTIGKVQSAPASAGTPANVAGSASSVTLAASNANRRGLTIFNDSSSALYVKFGATASTSSFTVKIAAGGYWEMPQPAYTGVVDGIWDAANGNARVTELS